jgi:hypothetical protein
MDHKIQSFNRRRMLQLVGISIVGSSLSTKLFSKEIAISDNRPYPPGKDPTSDQMQHHLKQANKVAKAAMNDGHHPFGAILVAADNETVVMEQGNIYSVAHAESTLAQRGAKQFTLDELWGMTLYTTAKPCVMYAGTQYWANIGFMVCQNANYSILPVIILKTRHWLCPTAIYSPVARRLFLCGVQ